MDISKCSVSSKEEFKHSRIALAVSRSPPGDNKDLSEGNFPRLALTWQTLIFLQEHLQHGYQW